jgi:hypothetical protein
MPLHMPVPDPKSVEIFVILTPECGQERCIKVSSLTAAPFHHFPPVFPLSLLSKVMSHPPSLQAWTDPSTGITYTRVEDGEWMRIDASHFDHIPSRVCHFDPITTLFLTHNHPSNSLVSMNHSPSLRLRACKAPRSAYYVIRLSCLDVYLLPAVPSSSR